MTNHLEAVRRLAHAVAERTTSELAFGLFRLYVAAAGATTNGAWIYIPGRATPLKGWKAVGAYVSALPDTSAFLRALANAYDLLDRELRPTPTAQTVAEPAEMLLAITTQVSALAKQIAAAEPPEPDTTAVIIGDNAYLDTLLAADVELARRIVRRAVYDAGKTMLGVLDGWIEGARQNWEAAGRRDPFDEQFYPDDFRNMINDMCRELGAPEPWQGRTS